MVTKVYLSEKRIDTSRRSSLLGEGIVTSSSLKATLLLVTVTRVGLTKSYQILLTRYLVYKAIDDALLLSDNLESSFFQACKWLDICGKNGIIQNPSKFKFGEDVVEFSGFEITLNSVRTAPSMLRAITDLPTLKNLTDFRSWFGLVNQVAYAFSITESLRAKAFQKSKLHIVNEIENGVKIFTKGKPTSSCNRLVKDWCGILVVPEALFVSDSQATVLQRRLANRSSWWPLYEPCRVTIRTRRRRSPSRCLLS